MVMVIVVVSNVGSWHESSGGESENGEADDGLQKSNLRKFFFLHKNH